MSKQKKKQVIINLVSSDSSVNGDEEDPYFEYHLQQLMDHAINRHSTMSKKKLMSALQSWYKLEYPQYKAPTLVQFGMEWDRYAEKDKHLGWVRSYVNRPTVILNGPSRHHVVMITEDEEEADIFPGVELSKKMGPAYVPYVVLSVEEQEEASYPIVVKIAVKGDGTSSEVLLDSDIVAPVGKPYLEWEYQRENYSYKLGSMTSTEFGKQVLEVETERRKRQAEVSDAMKEAKRYFRSVRSEDE